MFAYYSQVAVPVFVVLCIGAVLLVFSRKASAANRQFIAAATLGSCLAISFLPWVPVRFRPTVPEHFRPIITLHPSPTQTTQVDLFQLAASVRPPQLRLDLVGGVSLFLGLVSLTLAIRLLASWRLAKRLRNRSLEASDRIRSMTDKSVRVVEGLLSPAAFGGLEPIILLPAEAEEWPEDQLRAILIHESAHLDNSDPTWQLLAEIVCSLHWFGTCATPCEPRRSEQRTTR